MSQFGQYRSLIESLKGNANGSQGRVGAARAIDVYNRSKPFGTEASPTVSSTSDISVYIKAFYSGQSDLTATITSLSIPFLYANIRGVGRENESNLYGNIFPELSTSGVLYASLKGICSTSTEPLSYTNIILGTPGGATVVRRLVTTLPDLTATLYGWDYTDLNATIYVYQRGSYDLEATLGSVAAVSSNIGGTITATYTKDLLAYLVSIPYSTLNASLVSVPPLDLVGSMVPVPPKDLVAFGGGHYPEDIVSYLQTVPPEPITAFIRSGYSATSDLAASLIGTGGYGDIYSRISSLVTDNYSIDATITVKINYDLRARLHSWDLYSLSASVVGVNTSNFTAHVKGVSLRNERDLPSFIRSAWGGESNLNTSIYGWVSAHTSDKIYNYDVLPRPAKVIFLAHSVGLTMMSVEPIRGNFPDLHATVFGRAFSVYDVRAFIRPLVRVSQNITTTINAVDKVININKIPIEFSNVNDLLVSISAFSGYKNLSARIIGEVSTSTTTAGGSGWVYISSSINFYLGTNKGLFIPESTQRVIKSSVFRNSSPMPDLWAHARGWAEADLGATLTVYPDLALSAGIVGQDLSHIKGLSASVVSIYTRDLTASVVGSGGVKPLGATLEPSGAVSDFSASIVPYLKVLGFRVLSVETMPFTELQAVVNPISTCHVYSGYGGIGAFIRGTVPYSGGVDLLATINSLSDLWDLNATIIGRKITKIKIADVWFRSQTRDSSAISSLCIGVGNGTNDLVSSINGLSHTNDISASIVPFRHVFNKIPSVETIKVYKDYFTDIELYKTLDIHFVSAPEKLIFDSVVNAIYRVDGDKWALNLAELTDTGEFFDRSVDDRNYEIDSLIEYNSIDEAIRFAITILTEWRTSDLSATLTASGGYGEMAATIGALQPHRHLDLQAKVSIVNNLPLLGASISAYSGYGSFSAYIIGQGEGPENIEADIYGVVYDSLSASINVVT